MQQRNDYKTVDDFLVDESFRSWIRNQNDTTGWEEWTAENPQRTRLVEQARLWMLAIGVPETDTSADETHQALAQTWQKIRQAQTTPAKTVSLWQRLVWRNAAAAILVLGLGLVWFYKSRELPDKSLISYTELVKQGPDELIEQVNKTDKPQLITLSDGSSVLLEPNSRLSYPKAFEATNRKVYLSGEGFFEISKNAKRPFFVFSNELVTKVVGTSFRIKAYADQAHVDVLVRTGKVSVGPNEQFTRATTQEVVLLPNEGTRFTRQANVFKKLSRPTPDDVANAGEASIEQLSFEFRDAPVAQILETLEQAYPVKIDFPRQLLKDCYLTTSLTDQPLPEKLKIICESLGSQTSYDLKGNHIVIRSTGCN